ncbi:MAG TPA: hypothetical protein IAA79_08635 [Candidatus Avirikenella pullistercoris]|nr:hypothetical protein [Candidatus Avirikenella pullistercoris]
MSASPKKRLVVSYKNLSEELKEILRKKYPAGFQDSMIRVDKGPNDFFYAVVLETEEASYLVKVDVKIDDNIDDEEDKEYYNDDIEGADDIIDDSSEEDE